MRLAAAGPWTWPLAIIRRRAALGGARFAAQKLEPSQPPNQLRPQSRHNRRHHRTPPPPPAAETRRTAAAGGVRAEIHCSFPTAAPRPASSIDPSGQAAGSGLKSGDGAEEPGSPRQGDRSRLGAGAPKEEEKGTSFSGGHRARLVIASRHRPQEGRKSWKVLARRTGRARQQHSRRTAYDPPASKRAAQHRQYPAAPGVEATAGPVGDAFDHRAGLDGSLIPRLHREPRKCRSRT